MNSPSKQQRLLGGLYGSLVGDALGVPVEFLSRSACSSNPVRGMRGHGTHNQPAGTWSDDGSLLLCSVESLVEKGFNTQDMGERFVRWFKFGHWSAHGSVFDIGISTSQALRRIAQGMPAEAAGGQSLDDNGNGSLMRILPVVLATFTEEETEEETQFCSQLERASAITHGHEQSKLACAFFGLYVQALMLGGSPAEALTKARATFSQRYMTADLMPFQKVLHADIARWEVDDVKSGGYVMETLTASIWCLLTTNSFSECVLNAVNLGGDTDTTGCVAGGLAGVLYGVDAISADWRSALPQQEALEDLFGKFLR